MSMLARFSSLSAPAAAPAEAIDFDGTNDYLSRSSDLTGNADGKTFTFSAWVWNGVGGHIYQAGSSNGFNVTLSASAGLAGFNVYAYSPTSGGTPILDVSVSSAVPVNTFVHLLISVDLANSANRSVYLNDVLTTATWTTYTNDVIDRTQTVHTVGASGLFANKEKGRLSNVYLDYTYRDLSITANRRLFVTADLKPASGQAALNPILYLPMNDPTAPGTNAGTGGNFTLTGTVARSGRGPNQYNAPYSDLDGTADYLSRTTAPTGIANGKQFTLSVTFKLDTLSGTSAYPIAFVHTTTSLRGKFYLFINSLGVVNIYGKNSSDTTILRGSLPAGSVVPGRNYTCTISVDLTDIAKRHFYINGVDAGNIWLDYIDDNIVFIPVGDTPRWYIGAGWSLGLPDGQLGNVWFNTSYIDLSVPANLAKFVTGTGIDAKPVDLGANGELPTGTSPIIYLPMYGNNAGKNYGTGGDFTVNSGPYTGARGPNEFWGNRAQFNGTTGYLRRTSTAISNTKTLSLSCFVYLNARNTSPLIFYSGNNLGTRSAEFRINSGGTFALGFCNSAGSNIAVGSIGTDVFPVTTLHHLCVCIDLTDTAKRFVYINGVLQTVSWSVYTNDTIDFASYSSNQIIGATGDGTTFSGHLNGFLSEVYLTNSYIDFSLESNRLKFRDAFGNPTDLPAAIAAQSIPNPAIYMRFDPASFGTNSGTGGDFTVNGTITDGGQL